MKVSFYTSLILLLLSTSLASQTYRINNIDGNTINTCSGTFTDSGGSGSNYSNNESYTVTFCSNSGGNIQFNFTQWDVEDNNTCAWDYLRIYDGSNTSAPSIGEYCSFSPGFVQSSGSCLHFVWRADNIINESGWVASISCGTVTSSCGTGTSYEDEFSSSNYNNSNGLTNWTVQSWIEYDDEGPGPTAGEVRITGGELRMFRSDGSSPRIERAVNLSSAVSATWNFDYREASFLESADIFYAEVFNGSTWTTVLQRNNDFGTQSASIDITPYANANTRIRYRISGYAGTNEFVYVDNVDVCYEIGTIVNTDFYLEAECDYVGNAWFVAEDMTASNGSYVEPKVGEEYTTSPGVDTIYYLTYTIDVDSTGNYEVFGRIIAPNGNDDSFWVRVNGGQWYRWNGLSTNNNWTWLQVWDSDDSNAPVSFPLTAGENRLDFAIREDGVRLDKLYITLDGSLPTGEGGPSENCYSLFNEDTDQDGIVDGVDLDDDNDGILDIRESPAEIDFSGTRTLLVGSSQNNLQVNDKVLFDNAVRDCNDIIYDAVITINSKSPGVTVAANQNGIDISGAIASQDDHTTFTISIVENASATPGNPTGTPAIITDLTIDMQDVDSDTGDDYTEVVGFNNSNGPNSSYLFDPTGLEQGGFINGAGPSGSWTFYRQIPSSGASNWSGNDNISSAIFSPEIAVYMVFNDFSEVQLVFGLTGSLNSSPTIATRATRFGASAECDRDGDGIPNRLDLDLDNDGIYDMIEAGHGLADADNDGRIDGAVSGSGANGIFDGIETSPESGTLNYTYRQSDGDNIEDAFDRDSDGDGCFDTEEADNNDPDQDGVAGSGTATADANGLVISIVYHPPPTDSWRDPIASCLEICDNGIDDDGDGDIDDDDADCADYFLEAECGFPGDLWQRGFDAAASNNDYLSITPGNNAISSPPPGAASIVRFTATVDVTGTYRFLGRVYSFSGAEDSFWFRVDGGTWYRWNDWNTGGSWLWREFSDNSNGNTIVKFLLNAGVHTIDIAYSEEGARLDKLHLTINGTTPTGEGETAINCGRTMSTNLFVPYKIINRTN